MIKQLVKYIVAFLLLVLIQVLILNNIQLGGFINPYLYVLFILILPFEIPNLLLIIISFILGLSIDIFTNTLGMHIAACVFMAYLRPFVLKILAPRDGYEPETLPLVADYGFSWFLKYAAILIFAHHLFLFFIEVFRFSDLFRTLWRTISSSMFSLFLVIVSQYFYKR